MGHLRPAAATFQAKARRDPAFRAALLAEAIELLAQDDVETAKRMLRDYVLASIGYTDLAKRIGKKPESIMRMLSPKGNPTMKNMAALLSTLSRYEGVDIHVQATT